MDTTILLSKVIGLGLVIISLSFMLRRKHYAMALQEFVQARAMRMMLSLVELTAGLFLIMLHTDWSSPAASIITLIGWLAVVESTVYLFISDSAFARLIAAFNRPGWYIGGGLVGLVAGAYLALHGFGMLGM